MAPDSLSSTMLPSETIPDPAPAGPAPRSRRGRALRIGFAVLILAATAAASAQVMVPAGEAVVVTRLGDPVRVLTHPGLTWKLPAPVESTIPVDLRLRTTSGGLEDVGTRDGLRILVQAYLAWSVADDPAHIRQFIRAAGNDPDEAARQLRSFIGSALQVTASNFDLADLVNTDATKARLASFEDQLRANVAKQVLDIYGVDVQQVGVERISLPSETLAATVARMRAERETVAAERTAEGLRAAAAIRSDAQRDARITVARAKADAAGIEAKSRQRAAEIYAASYNRDPQLYTLLRSLDTLGSVIGPRTRLLLRTDAAPFDVLVSGPRLDHVAASPRPVPSAEPVAPRATSPGAPSADISEASPSDPQTPPSARVSDTSPDKPPAATPSEDETPPASEPAPPLKLPALMGLLRGAR